MQYRSDGVCKPLDRKNVCFETLPPNLEQDVGLFQKHVRRSKLYKRLVYESQSPRQILIELRVVKTSAAPTTLLPVRLVLVISSLSILHLNPQRFATFTCSRGSSAAGGSCSHRGQTARRQQTLPFHLLGIGESRLTVWPSMDPPQKTVTQIMEPDPLRKHKHCGMSLNKASSMAFQSQKIELEQKERCNKH